VVCWEDEALLAAAKPPGVRSAPVHRFEGHNMLGRMIHRLSYEPHLLHRCVLHCAGMVVYSRAAAGRCQHVAVVWGGSRPPVHWAFGLFGAMQL
jgi:23S rRNA-/tRNA-specific pseudouridylate synthase